MNAKFRKPSHWLLAFGLLCMILIAGGAYAQIKPGLTTEPIQTNDLPPTKLALLQMIDATQVAAMTAIPTAPRDLNYRPRPTPLPRRTATTQILEGYQPPMPSSVFTAGNQWAGNIGGCDVGVYAGLLHYTDPPQGALIVETDSCPQFTVLRHGENYPPTVAGLLRIESFQGTVLTVVDTQNKQRFLFDVATQTWGKAP
ncbi:MAG: hypothetical protein M3Z04_03615 [Chloroflexota bacterium]|nr:hypothetical protein [Chloroflexota bacterium]